MISMLNLLGNLRVGDFDLLKLGIKGVFLVDLGIWVLLGWGQISL